MQDNSSLQQERASLLREIDDLQDERDRQRLELARLASQKDELTAQCERLAAHLETLREEGGRQTRDINPAPPAGTDYPNLLSALSLRLERLEERLNRLSALFPL